MPFTSKHESNTVRTIPKRERRCVPWVSKTYDDEKVLQDVHRSHSEKSWNIICDKFNEMVPSYRQRSVDAVYSKWKILRLRSRSAPTSTPLTSKESFVQAREPQELVRQVQVIWARSCFFAECFSLIHSHKGTLVGDEIQYEDDLNNFEPTVAGWDGGMDVEGYALQVTELMEAQREMARMATEAACGFRFQ